MKPITDNLEDDKFTVSADLLKLASRAFWLQLVGNATDTIVKPVQIERDERIEDVKSFKKERNV
jgi:hypothetical protein